MIFSRNQLNAFERFPKYAAPATARLLAAALEGVELTLAESKFLGTALNAAYTDDEEGITALREVYLSLTDFHFWEKYGLYGKDLEGQYAKETPYGILSIEDKQLDVAYLEQQYQKWIQIVEKENHTDQLLQFLAIEARKTIKEVLSFSKSRGDGGNHQRYIRKSLTLHSKYIHLKVKEYYQEYPAKEESIIICKSRFVVDINTYIHILFRHFGESIMAGRPGKTYHYDRNIDIENLPAQIFRILDEYDHATGAAEIKTEVIFLNLNGGKYAIWFQPKSRKLKDKSTESYYQVATFYPVGLKRDLDLINQLKLVMANATLGFYIQI